MRMNQTVKMLEIIIHLEIRPWDDYDHLAGEKDSSAGVSSFELVSR